MSGFYKDEKVMIICDRYPEGTVGIIIDRVADFVYSVRMCIECCTLDEEFLDHELEPYKEPRWRTLIDAYLKQRKSDFDPSFDI